MKLKNTFLFATALLIFIFVACVGEAQNTNKKNQKQEKSNIELIQFHSTHRCMTCNKIELLTKETLESFPAISFVLINVDDAKNEKKATQFEATGTALYLYNSKTGKKKDLTDFAFMNAKNKSKYMEGLKKEINKFID